MWNTNILMKKNSHSRVTQTICSLAPIKDYGLNYGAGVGIRTLDFNPGQGCKVRMTLIFSYVNYKIFIIIIDHVGHRWDVKK